MPVLSESKARQDRQENRSIFEPQRHREKQILLLIKSNIYIDSPFWAFNKSANLSSNKSTNLVRRHLPLMPSIFRTTQTDSAAVQASWFLGATLSGIVVSEPGCSRFSFSSGASIDVECLWRLLNSGALVITSEDHEYRFGLERPVDAASLVLDLLGKSTVVEFSLRQDTLDLFFKFSMGHRLEILPTSAGYEAWQIVSPGRQHIIAQGGGQLSTYTE